MAIADPMDLAHLHAMEVASGLKVRPLIAREKEIQTRIDALFEEEALTDSDTDSQLGGEVERIGDEEDVEYLRDMASEVPVIRTVNQIVARALERRASDIHLEPFER